jgi:hypothetical protein
MYRQKAHDILSSSINSAVYIDEKAKDFFSGEPINTDIPEEKLSINLYNTFKDNGKSLTVHKFNKTDIKDEKIIEYLFNNKDLILLDWELDDVSGQEFSLGLLLHAISLPYINFTCIYSSTSNFDKIPFFLKAYFSGLSKENFVSISEKYEYIDISDINEFRNSSNSIEDFFKENEIEQETFPIEKCKNYSFEDLLDLIIIGLENEKYIFPIENIEGFEVIDTGDNSFLINNTLVFTLKKDEEIDNNFSKLIGRITDEVIKNDSSFFQLLGLEMQSVFNSSEQFIDNTILKSSTEALFNFRRHIDNDKTFGIIIKKLLLEQATLKLRTAKLEILESDFLEAHGSTLTNDASSEDLMQLNTFYNAVSVKSLNDQDIPNLNFGDVFKDQNSNYYLCITALCDCYYPNKINFNYYFVEGTEFKDTELALTLGDTAFLSFLPDGKAIYWGDLEKPKLKNTKPAHLLESLDDVSKLKKNIKTLKQKVINYETNQAILHQFLYKPFYIKPKVFNVTNNKLIDNKINIWDITNKIKKNVSNQDLNHFEVEYIITLRNDYTQRLANHAFGHPARVGVDFVKK